MKNILIVFFLVIPSVYNNAQERNKPEYYTVSKNLSGSGSITFYCDKLEALYCESSPCSNCTSNAQETAPYNSILPTIYGFDACYEYGSELDIIGYSLYRVTCDYPGSSAYFFIDMRDKNYRSGYASADFNILYDGSLDQFAITSSGANQTYVYYRNGGMAQIWKIKTPNANPDTSPYPNYWATALGLNKSNNNIKLVWGTYPNNQLNITGYRIYKKDPPGDFTQFANVDQNTFEYIDYSEFFYSPGNPSEYVYYYVKAVYDQSNETEATNTVSVKVNGDINKSTPPPKKPHNC